MHSALQRLNSLTSLSLSILSCLLLAISCSSLLALPSSPLPNTSVLVQTPKVHFGRAREWKAPEQEFAFLEFDLRADTRPLWNWNTKQLLLQLSAEYRTPNSTRPINNNLVFWDKLVLSKEKARLNLSGAKNKYTFKEPSKSFKDVTDVSFVLSYHLMPYVGLLKSGEIGRSEIALEKFPVATRKA